MPMPRTPLGPASIDARSADAGDGPSTRRAARVPVAAWMQAAGLAAAYAVVEQVCDAWHIGTLSAPLGFLLLSALLLSGRLPVDAVALGGKWLIGFSTLFLVPAMVAVAPAWPVLRADWLPLTVIIVGGTVSTMLLTAWSVEATCRWMARRR
jgi:holin-like protein